MSTEQTEQTPQEEQEAAELPTQQEGQTEQQSEPQPEPVPEPEPKQEPEPEPKQEPEEPVKAKPAPPPVDYRSVMSGNVRRQGYIFKGKWNEQWMTLDEDGAFIRWYRDEARTGFDGQIPTSVVAEVAEPSEQRNTTWPPETDDCRFVVVSKWRIYFLVAASKDERDAWIQKITEAKNKFNPDGTELVSPALISVEAVTKSIEELTQRTEAEVDTTLEQEGTSTKQLEKDLNKAADEAVKDVEKVVETEGKEVEVAVDSAAKDLDNEVQKETEPQETVTVAVEVEVQQAEEEPQQQQEGDKAD